MRLFATFAITTVLFTGCGEQDNVTTETIENEDGSTTVVAETTATLPLLPIDLPVYPTALTLDGLAAQAKSKTDDLLNSYISSSVPSFLRSGAVNLVSSALSTDNFDQAVSGLDTALKEATSSILQPGSLSTAIKNRISGLEKVEVVSVKVKMEVENKTNSYAAVPSLFKIYIGDATKVNEKHEAVAIPFKLESNDSAETETGSATDTTDSTDNTESTDTANAVDSASFTESEPFTIKPGADSRTYVTDNVAQLVDLTNKILQGEEVNIGIGYINHYRMTDVENGADVPTFVEKFGACILTKALAINGVDISSFNVPTDTCPTYQDLLGWKLNFKKLEFEIKAKAEVLTIPPTPTCKELAEEFGLDKLSEACPE